MSGPKGGSYTVETEEAREARAYAAALAGYEQTRLAVARLRVEALAARSALGTAIPVPVELRAATAIGRRSTDVLEADRAGRVRLREAEQQLHAAAGALTRERWQQRCGTVPADDRQFASAAEQVRGAPIPRQLDDRDQAERWRTDCLAQLAEIAGSWPLGQGTAVLDGATENLHECRGASAGALAVTRARDELRRLRVAARVVRDRDAELARLRATVESVRQWQQPTSTSDILAEITSTAELTTVPAGLVQRVEQHAAEAHARRDRDEASAILADVLVELGYRIGEGFTTRLSGPADVLVGKPGWSDHAVSVRLDGAGKIFTHVVRAADAPASDDERCDAEFCTDFDKLAHQAGRRGLELTSVRRFTPGEHALRTVPTNRVRDVAPSSQQRVKQRQR